MASGLGVNDDCMKAINLIKLGNLKDRPKFIIYGVSDDLTEARVFDMVPPDPSKSEAEQYEHFVKTYLPENECRWAVYDFVYEKDGVKRNKLLFIAWAPESSKLRPRMVYASSKQEFRAKLDIASEIQATDFDEVSYDSVNAKVTK
ncbi:cofilin/tropomyosin-type actin-binding protein [Ceratobasidium sp. AG-Ba]|nr:cofilin/tropomyosin-type actin-binding protein [Ceratobasidium sp. AG-Ba]